MDDLTAFIAARLDEDEALAMAAASDARRFGGRAHWTSDAAMVTDAEDPDWAICDLSPFVEDERLARHIARHDPARALREVAAKRAIAALHHPDAPGKWPNCAECSCEGALAATDCLGTVSWPCPTVRHLAAIWSDHPRYRAEWGAE